LGISSATCDFERSLRPDPDLSAMMKIGIGGLTSLRFKAVSVTSISVPVEINTAASKLYRLVKDTADLPSATLVILQPVARRRPSAAWDRSEHTSKIFFDVMMEYRNHNFTDAVYFWRSNNARCRGVFNTFTLRLCYFPASWNRLGRVCECSSACAANNP